MTAMLRVVCLLLLLLLLLVTVPRAPAIPNTTQSQLRLHYNALANQPALTETGLSGAVVLRGGEGSSGIAAWSDVKGTYIQEAGGGAGGVVNVGY